MTNTSHCYFLSFFVANLSRVPSFLNYTLWSSFALRPLFSLLSTFAFLSPVIIFIYPLSISLCLFTLTFFHLYIFLYILPLQNLLLLFTVFLFPIWYSGLSYPYSFSISLYDLTSIFSHLYLILSSYFILVLFSLHLASRYRYLLSYHRDLSSHFNPYCLLLLYPVSSFFLPYGSLQSFLFLFLPLISFLLFFVL